MPYKPYLADFVKYGSINSTLSMRNCPILWQSRIWIHKLGLIQHPTPVGLVHLRCPNISPSVSSNVI